MNSALKLARRSAKKRFERIKKVSTELRVNNGWIAYIRMLKGMSLSQLAKRVGVSGPAMTKAEKAEVEGGITIKRLKRMADALDCDFVYALIPRKDIEKEIKERALEIARSLLSQTDMNMELEDQKVDRHEQELQIKELARKLEKSKIIWE